MRLCLFGAAPGTGNLGVSALCQSALAGILDDVPAAEVTVFDYGRGRRTARLRTGSGEASYQRIGAVHSRRYYRPENLRLMSVCGRLGLPWPVGVRAIRSADAVLDVSGGDSFTDLYGQARFESITLPKRIALDLGTPLVLLPQTYGPFREAASRERAASLVRGASLAWARDEHSFEILRDLLGDAFDPERHRSGVDMAFALKPIETALPEALVRWLSDRDAPVVGVNVSGLLANHAPRAARYGFRADYDEAVFALVRGLLRECGCRVLLVPHVVTSVDHYESDTRASQALAARLRDGGAFDDRLLVLPPAYEADEIKWVIGQLDWFCGTRMHSTIAALSSGVPAAAISYSDKTQGVFETCGQGERVADPRRLATEALVEQLMGCWRERASARQALAARIPAVRGQAVAQLRQILSGLASGHDQAGRLGAALTELDA